MIDDNTLGLPGDPYAAATLRTFDPKTGLWSIWWIDSRRPGIGEPVHGRVLWSGITPTTARSAQAFAADGGDTRETNRVMDFTRAE